MAPDRTGPDWSSTRWDGRSTTAPAGDRFSIISASGWFRSASWCTSTMPTPMLSPFEEFQRLKTHPLVRETFCGRPADRLRGAGDRGRRLAIGAAAGISRRGADRRCGGLSQRAAHQRAPITPCGRESLRPTTWPPRSPPAAPMMNLTAYDEAWRGSAIGTDLWKVRNAKPLWSRFGTALGIGLAGADMWAASLGLSPFGTLRHGKPDSACLKPAARCRPIAYPRPDGTAHLRSPVVGVPLQYQPRGRSAGAFAPARSGPSGGPPNTISMAVPRRAIARLGFMSGCSRTAPGATSSTRKTASTAKPATSRIRTAISNG